MYENDANGNAISGDINKLVEAAENGVDVKIIIDDGTYKASMFVDVVHINTVDSNNPIIGAKVTTHMGLQNLQDGSWVHNENLFYVFTVVNTTGVVHYSRYYIDGTKNSETTYQKHLRWYIKY